MVLPLIPLAAALIPLIAEIAPTIARRLGGKEAEETAERVIGVVEAVTGREIRQPSDVRELNLEFHRDPALRAEFEMAIAQANAAMEAAYLADRQDARARDVAIQTTTGGNSRANLMLFSAFAAVVSIVALLILQPGIPPEVVGFVTTLGGMFARNIGSAFDFEFGSSRGSKDKTEQMKALLARAPETIGGMRDG